MRANPQFREGDLLFGTRAIATFLGIRPDKAYYLITAEILPSFRIGRTRCANRTKLTEWMAQQEAAGTHTV